MQRSTPSGRTAKSEERRLLLAVLLISAVIVVALGSIAVLGAYDLSKFIPTDRSTIIVNGSVSVPAGHYHYYWVTVRSGETSLSITGSFVASGGTANDIEVLVMDQPSYESWMNGYQVTTFFDSGRVSNGNIYATLPGSGTYYLIYDNTFSTIYDKSIQTNAMFHFHG